MPATPSTAQVWSEIGRQIFAVLGFVTKSGAARTAGIVYAVADHRLYIGTDRMSWKARHIQENPNVSLTVTVAKRIPFIPWIKIPPATISFQGKAAVHGIDEVDSAVQRRLFRGLELKAEVRERTCIICVEPVGEFITYGVGVPLLTMRVPEQAKGRVPVSAPGH
jgi:hypothetical protein